MANIIDEISQEIIDSTQSLQAQTITYINRAFDVAFETGLPTVIFQQGITIPDMSDVYSSLPNPSRWDLTVDLRADFNSEYDALISQLQTRIPNEFNNFLSQNFPNNTNAWNQMESFLLDSLTNGTIGLPKEVEQMEWDQARERDIFDGKRAEKLALRSASKRGTSYLQPTINWTILQAKNDSIRNQSGTNRQIAIDSAKLRIDFIKTTIGSIVETQRIAIDSTLNYLQQVLSSYNLADSKARDYTSAYTQLYQALNSYYDAVARLAQIKFEAKKEVYDNRFNYYHENLNYINQSRDRNSRIALQSAQIVGQEASSAFSGLNVLAGYGNITNA